MFPFIPAKKEEKSRFIQQHLYIEDYIPLKEKYEKAQEKEDNDGIIVIDILSK